MNLTELKKAVSDTTELSHTDAEKVIKAGVTKKQDEKLNATCRVSEY